jgi:hypothetical protein
MSSTRRSGRLGKAIAQGTAPAPAVMKGKKKGNVHPRKGQQAIPIPEEFTTAELRAMLAAREKMDTSEDGEWVNAEQKKKKKRAS